MEIYGQTSILHFVYCMIFAALISRKFPELYKWFKDFLGYKESGGHVEAIPSNVANKDRIGSDLAMEIGECNFISCAHHSFMCRKSAQ